LSTAVHDAAAVRIGRSVYLFGGGTNAGVQADTIVRVAGGGGQPVDVGRLPAPSSDHAAAVIDGTAYIVGGYTGTRWLDTIVSWRPGAPARVVAHLPFPLRYAAVAAAAGRLVIAGGSRPDGSAGSAVLEYAPATHRLVRIGLLPVGTTHAAAASLGGVVYVIGGRGTNLGSATARIVAVDVPTHRVRIAGALRAPRSDLAATASRSNILLAGGRAASGTLAGLSELVPIRIRARASTRSVYAHDGAGMLVGASRLARPLIYVPNSGSDTVDVIDPRTFKIVEHFAVGGLPQHVVPSWDLRTLYVTNDTGNSLTPIDPQTGRPKGAPIPVDDPYNMYFTPNGRYAIVVAERLHRLDFRDAHSFRLHRSLTVPCLGVDHMDFTADGRFLLASCEFSGQMVEVDVQRERVVRTVSLPDGRAGMPQDVKLSPDGRLFYVADMRAGGVWEIGAHSYRVLRFLATGAGTHGLYPSRNGRSLYVTNRSEGSVSVISFRTRTQVRKLRIPGSANPDMGGVSSDGKVLWLSGRYNGEVNAISTGTGRLLARIPVGVDPPRAMRVATARALLARAYRRLAVANAASLVFGDYSTLPNESASFRRGSGSE
jgi:YVTN family beta-propeller protein